MRADDFLDDKKPTASSFLDRDQPTGFKTKSLAELLSTYGQPDTLNEGAKVVSGLPGVLEVGARRGYAGIGKVEQGALSILGDLLNSESLRGASDVVGDRARQIENSAVLQGKRSTGFAPDSIVNDLPEAGANAVSSVIQTAPSLLAGAVVPGAALPALFGQTFGQEYAQGKDAGLTPMKAAGRAVPMAAFEVAGEKLGGFDSLAAGLRKATAGNGVADLGSAMLSSALKEIPSEEFTTTGQFLTDKAPVIGINQDATLADYGQQVKDTALATALQSGVMGAGGRILQGRSAPGQSVMTGMDQAQDVQPEQPAAQPVINPDAIMSAISQATSNVKPSAAAFLDADTTEAANVSQPTQQPIAGVDSAATGLQPDNGTGSPAAEPVAPNANAGSDSAAPNGALPASDIPDGALPVQQPADLAQATTEQSSAVEPPAQQPKKPVSKPRANTLLSAIDGLGGIDNKYKWDISGEQKFARGGYNKVFKNASTKTLEQHIENGDLDEFLPYDMRSTVTDDPTAGRDYLADRIRNGDRVLPYDVELEAKQSKVYESDPLQTDIESAITDDTLDLETVNALLSEAGYEEREQQTESRYIEAESTDSGSTNTAENTESESAASSIAGDQGRQAGQTARAEPATQNEVVGTLGSNEREGTRQHVEAIVRRRAAANQLGKLKPFDNALKLAKDFMAGEPVSPGKFKNAATMFANDKPLADAFTALQELAKSPAKEARQNTRSAVDIFTEQINNAKTVDELRNIARNIQMETGVLNDAMAQQLDDMVMERIDAIENSGDLLGDNTEKQQAVADAERTKDEKRNAGTDNAGDFVLTGSDRPADQAAARGAQDMFDSEDNPSFKRSDDDELSVAAKKYFGTTLNKNEAGYILPDGTMLDLSGKHIASKDNWKYMRGERATDHREFFAENIHNGAKLDGLIKAKDGNDAMLEFMARTGAMRVDFQAGVASIAVPPSSKQINSLGNGMRGEYLALEYFDSKTGRIIDDIEIESSSPSKVKQFFDAAITKTASKDAAMFKRDAITDAIAGIGRQQAQAVDRVQSQIDTITKGWKNAPTIQVVYDMTDESIPEAVRNENERQLSQGATGQPQGFIIRGKVFIVASEMNSMDDVTRVLFHESLGHYGLRGMYDKPALVAALNRVATMRASDVAKKAKQYGLNINNPSDRLIAAEEVLAEMAETKPEIGVVKQVIAAIRAWLRENIPYFKNLELSDAEIIRDYILPARRYVERGGAPKSAGDVVAAFQRSNPQTETEAFKKWFGDSKVVDAEGKPLVVYHGTPDMRFMKDDATFRNRWSGSTEGAHWFTPSQNVARTYADPRRAFDYQNAEEGIIPAYLSMKNPLEIDAEGAYWRDAQRRGKTSDVIAKAKEGGHDGVIIKNVKDDYNNGRGTKPTDTYVVFDSAQIKSAIGNNGNFDQNDQRITFKRSTEDQPNRSMMRDELGRFKSPTGIIYDKTADIVQTLAQKVAFGQAPKELRTMTRLYKADIQKAMDAASNVVKTMAPMSQIDRALVSDVVEKMVATGVTPPESIVKIATGMQNAMDIQTDELVSLGMLSQDSADRWRGKYLPRFYMRENNEGVKAWVGKMLRNSLPVRGIGGNSLKGRGLFEEVNVNEVPKYEALGWEVRDPLWKKNRQGELELMDANKVVTPEKVVVWRDWTPSERAEMGENRDALFRFVMGYTSMQNDIALGRLFDSIAKNQEWTRARASDGYVKVPDSEIPETGGVKRYGNLAGLYVKKEILDHISQYEEASELWKYYRKALSFWKAGKALALDTPIPTLSGWSTMGEIKTGDTVFDEHGKPCKVTFATGVQLERECYEVEFSDGTKIIADAEHLWFTIYHGKGSVKNTKLIMDTLKERTRGDNNHSIPVAGALQTPDADLPIPPYALGAWLGDGHSYSAAICAGAKDADETAANVRAAGLAVGAYSIDKRNGVVTFGIRYTDSSLKRCDGLQPVMRRMNLLRNKHIPAIYLRASEAQRRDLLCGLMDTDGYITENGKCEFSTTSPQVRDGMMELLRSLGYKPVCGSYTARLNGRNCGDSWRIMFQAYGDRPVFKMARKLDRMRDCPKTRQRSGTRQIVAIRPVPSVPVKCIQVDSESRLYLAGDGMVPTHNTVLNPVAHVNNVVSNLTMAHFAGVSYWDSHKYIAAIKDLAKNAPMVQEAKDRGLMTGDITRAELMADMPDDIKAMMQMQESQLKRKASTVFNIVTFGLSKPMGKAYRLEDDFFKYLIYRDARKNGLSPDDAVDYATKYIFTYDDLPKGARTVRDLAIPFFAYTYKAVPALTHTLLNYPWRFAAPAAAIGGINAIAYAFASGDDDWDWYSEGFKGAVNSSVKMFSLGFSDDVMKTKGAELEREERKNLPPWMQGRSALGTEKNIRLGTDEKNQLPVYMDVSRMIPGGDIFDVTNQADGVPVPAPIMPSNPILTTIAAMFWNKDTFTGKEVTDLNDTGTEAAKKRAEWLLKQISPGIAPTSYHADRLAEAVAMTSESTIETPWKDYTGYGKDGLAVQKKYAIPQTFGIKARPIDLERSAEISKGMDNKEIRSIMAEVRQAARLLDQKAISQREYDRRVSDAEAKIDAIENK